MTIAIASYRRREALLRLLRALDDEVAGDPAAGDGVDVVVVLDGSDDGSREAVEAETWNLPVRVHWQPNRGLAATRNVGLALAAGEIVWFLDDDVIPTPGLLARHRALHDGDGDDDVVVGVCVIPDDSEVPDDAREWWAAHHAELHSRGVIERFDLFTAANASGPTACFRDVGGFDERFVEYGCEDFELGARLLDAGVRIRFDGDAVALHPEHVSFAEMVRRQRSIGRNSVLIAREHPHTAAALFPTNPGGRTTTFLRRLPTRAPGAYASLARLAETAARRGRRVLGTRTTRQLQHIALAASFAAGVADADPDGRYLVRVLGET
ncbi:MAG TPA: glycosyltransferase [Acidimicrobiia bacterium]|nr:glycosyltransferase [Acidimicrobiia bacterium]